MNAQSNVAPLPLQTVAANEKGQMNMISLLMNESAMTNIERMAGMLAGSKISVPEHLRSNPSDCFAICMQSIQWGMNPFAVAQKTHLVKGTLGYEAQLVNAVITNSGVIRGRFDYEFVGPWERVIGKVLVKRNQKDGKDYTYRVPNWTAQDEEGCGVTVRATLANGETRSRTIMLSQALTRNSTLWADDPQQQLAYLAVKRWARMYAPDVILGVYTVDELEERELNPVTPETKSNIDQVKARAEQARRDAKLAENHGIVIDAETVSSSEPDTGENLDDVPEQPAIDPQQALEIYTDFLNRLELAENRQELKDISTEMAVNRENLNPEQREDLNKAYRRNKERLGIKKST